MITTLENRLVKACKKADFEAVLKYLYKGADVNFSKSVCLNHTITSGNLQILSILLDYKIKIEFDHLSLIVDLNKLEVMKFLIKNHVPIRYIENNYASFNGSLILDHCVSEEMLMALAPLYSLEELTKLMKGCVPKRGPSPFIGEYINRYLMKQKILNKMNENFGEYESK